MGEEQVLDQRPTERAESPTQSVKPGGLMELEKSLSLSQKFLQKVITQADSIVKGSYVVAYLIAKKIKTIY